MKQPNNYENTQAAGSFEPIALGGHKMVIKQVVERTTKNGDPMIVVLLDKNTGIETDLALDSYTFTADADDDERFEVRLSADDRVTAIDGVFAKEKISVVGNAVVVSAGSDVNVELFNMAGSMVAKACGRNVTLNAAPGLYVVKLGETTHKVIIGK